MLSRLIHSLLLLFINGACSYAQNDTMAQNKGMFTYTYENDMFVATDRYYTQGIKPELVHPALSKIPTQKFLISAKNATQKIYGINVTQLCYTPRSIRYDTIKTGERPYSASIFVSHFSVANNSHKNIRVTSKIDLGIIGPCAVCEQEQKGIHRILKNIQPLGWEYQLGNDLLLNYNLSIDKAIILEPQVEFIALSKMRIGTIHADMGFGYLLRFGKMNGYFKAYGLTGYQKKIQFNMYVKGFATIVAYNAHLQGGLFSRDVYTLSTAAVTRFVATMETGVNLAFKRFALGYNLHWISPEFTFGIIHGWGACYLSFGF